MRGTKMKLQKVEPVEFELAEVESYLLVKGFELTKEDLIELKNIQDLACTQNEMVEMDKMKFLTIIKPFSQSPYLLFNNYLEILKNAIHLFYGVRCKFDWHISDDELINVIYDSYLHAYGIIDKDLKKEVYARLKKEGYSNRDNQSN